jgi:pimeloyl-CoA synthetase
MKIGDLVEIGWDGKALKPFIGVIVEMCASAGGQTGYVTVNGQTHYVDLEKLRKIDDSTGGSSSVIKQPDDWSSDIEEQG